MTACAVNSPTKEVGAYCAVYMEYDWKLGFIGGDRRFLACAKALSEKGMECTLFGFDREPDIGLCTRCDSPEDILKGIKAVILPLPTTCDGKHIHMPLSENSLSIEHFFECVPNNVPVLYGGAELLVSALSKQYGVTCVNYAASEAFQTANAISTAEGAIERMLQESDRTLCGSTCLVIGYGRIGKHLCRLLHAFGARVYASARKREHQILIHAAGDIPVCTENVGNVITSCDWIINTVPHVLLDRRVLEKVHKDAVILDLASRPGGVEQEAARELGKRVLWALALPGKTAPLTAADDLAQTLLTLLAQTADVPEGREKLCLDMP